MKKTFMPLHLGIGRLNRRALSGVQSLSATEKGCFNTERSILARFPVLDSLFQWATPINPAAGSASRSGLRTPLPSPWGRQPPSPTASASLKPLESTCFLHAHSLHPSGLWLQPPSWSSWGQCPRFSDLSFAGVTVSIRRCLPSTPVRDKGRRPCTAPTYSRSSVLVIRVWLEGSLLKPHLQNPSVPTLSSKLLVKNIVSFINKP